MRECGADEVENGRCLGQRVEDCEKDNRIFRPCGEKDYRIQRPLCRFRVFRLALRRPREASAKGCPKIKLFQSENLRFSCPKVSFFRPKMREPCPKLQFDIIAVIWQQ
jgi:hypothetical protein